MSIKASRLSIAVSVMLIAWALAIHVTFLLAVPDPIFQPDSAGYAALAVSRFDGSPQQIPSDRSPAYPLFLDVLLKTAGTFFAVLVFQHLLLILTGVAAAWTYYRYFRRSLLGASLVFFASTALPVSLIYAHSLLTETLYGFFLMVSVMCLLTAEESEHLAWAYVGSVFVMLSILTRPTGLSLLTALIAVALISWVVQRSRSGFRVGALVATILWLIVCSFNRLQNGFFGTDQMSGPALFCSNARYLDPNQIDDPAVKALMLPIYAQHPQDIANGQWVYSDPQGPVKILSAHFAPVQTHDILFHLGLQAIAEHPLRFAMDRIKLAGEFVLYYSDIPGIYLNREFTFFVYRGLLIFNAMLGTPTTAWRLMRHPLSEIQAYYVRVRPLALGQVANPEAYLRQLDTLDVYRYDKVLLWWEPIHALFRAIRWLPSLAILCAILLWKQKDRRENLRFILLVISLHILISTLAAFQDPRFAAPLTPLYLIVVIAGLQSLLDAP